MPEQFRDGGQGELLASYMSGTFSEDAARKLCFEQDNQIRVLKQEVEYRKKRDEKLTYVAADITGKLADAEIELGALRARYREAVEALGRAHGLLDCRKYRMAEPSACTPDNLCPECLVAADADAVLAKAREAGVLPEEEPHGR